MAHRVHIFDTTRENMLAWKNYYQLLSNCSVYNSPEYLQVLENHYQNKASLFIFEDGNNFVYYPYFKRNLQGLPYSDQCSLDLTQYFDITSSWYYGGPIVFTDDPKAVDNLAKEFRKHFNAYCKDSNIVSEFIRFDPNADNHLILTGILEVIPNRKSVFVDLTQSEDIIWNQYQGRCRTSIRKALKGKLTTKPTTAVKDVIRFAEIYSTEMERKKALLHYRFDTHFFLDLFKKMKNKAILIAAYHEDEFVGASICLYNQEFAHNYLMASSYDHWKLQPNNLILHEAIKWSKAKDIKIYDLQGGREQVYKFKKSFSPLRKTFYTAGIILNNTVYKRLCTHKTESAYSNIKGYFPKYR